MDEILWCDHSYSSMLSHGRNWFSIFYDLVILEFSIFCLVTYQCISLFEEVSCVLDDAFTKVLLSLLGLVPKPPFKMAQELKK